MIYWIVTEGGILYKACCQEENCDPGIIIIEHLQIAKKPLPTTQNLCGNAGFLVLTLLFKSISSEIFLQKIFAMSKH